MVIWFRFLMREDPPCSEFVRKRKGLHNNNSVIQSFSHSVIQSFSHSVIQSFLSKYNSFRLVNTQIVNNPFGSTLVTALIVTALIGFSFTAIVSQMINQQKEGRSIQQQMAVATLKYQVLQTLQNKDKCSCQFTQNIKSQTSEGHLTDFSTLRSSCDSGSEIIIENGRFLGSGVNVGSIKVSDVSNIPGSTVEYSGKLIVPLKGNLVRAIRPIEIPMYFVSDSSGQIQECGANEGHTAEIREERRRLMADLDTQDQEIKDLTETFNTHRHQHTHPFHRHFTPPPIILASNNNNGGSSGGGGDNDKPPDRRPSNSDGGVTFFNNGGSSGGGGGDNDKPPDRRPSNSDGGVTFFNNGGSSGGGGGDNDKPPDRRPSNSDGGVTLVKVREGDSVSWSSVSDDGVVENDVWWCKQKPKACEQIWEMSGKNEVVDGKPIRKR